VQIEVLDAATGERVSGVRLQHECYRKADPDDESSWEWEAEGSSDIIEDPDNGIYYFGKMVDDGLELSPWGALPGEQNRVMIVSAPESYTTVWDTDRSENIFTIDAAMAKDSSQAGMTELKLYLEPMAEPEMETEDTGIVLAKDDSGMPKEDGSGVYAESTLYPDSTLLEVLKKDAKGEWLGNITLLNEKEEKEIIDSTDPDKKPDSASVLSADSVLTVAFEKLQVDEQKVQSSLIYTYALPRELVPVLEKSEEGIPQNGWQDLRPSGDVRAHGRIVQEDDKYRFEIYFEDTENKYDIEFGYTYSATIHEEHQGGGKVEVTWPINKTLAFEVETPETEKLLTLEKSAYWTWDTDHSKKSGSDSVGGNTPYNQAVYEIVLTNRTDEPLSASLSETLDENKLIMEYTDIFPVEVWVQETEGTDFIKQEMTRNNLFGAVNKNKSINIQVIDPYNGAVPYATKGFDVTIDNLACHAVKLVCYASPYYGEGTKAALRYNSDNQSSIFGENQYDFASETTITALTSPVLKDGAYDKSVSATVSKSYTSTGGYTLEMKQTGVRTGTEDKIDPNARVDFIVSNIQTGGEGFVVLDESPYGDDYGFGKEYSSRNYYFPASGFYWGPNSLFQMMLKNVQICVSDGNGSTETLSWENTCPVEMLKIWYGKEYLELRTLFQESGYSIDDYDNGKLPICFAQEVTLNGASRNIIVAISPDTWENGSYSINSLNWTAFAPLVEKGKGNIPAGIKLYVLGLQGNETLTLKYSKYQRTLTYPADALEKDSTGMYRKERDPLVGSILFIRNRAFQGFRETYSTDENVANLMTKEGELLADGSIKYTLTIDVDTLYKTINGNSNSYDGWITAVGPVIGKELYVYEQIPDGYTFSEQRKYNENFQPASGGSYQNGCLYLMNEAGKPGSNSIADFKQYNSSHPTPEFLKGGNRWCASYETSDLLQASFEEQGKRVVRLMYIVSPDSAGGYDRLGVNEVYNAAELIIPHEGGLSAGLYVVDAVAACNTVIPGLESKSMSNTEANKTNTWTSEITTGTYNWSYTDLDKQPYLLNGSFTLYDHMQNAEAVDSHGNTYDKIARYIKLTSLSYEGSTRGADGIVRSFKDTIQIADENVIASGDVDAGGKLLYTLGFDSKQGIKYGFDRYAKTLTASPLRKPVTVYVDYAKERSKYNGPVTECGNVHYGGDYYGMYGGFELDISGLEDVMSLTIRYTTEFDCEAFARDYPEAGQVQITINNEAKRNYTNIGSDSHSVTSEVKSWTYAVLPDLSKKSEGETGGTSLGYSSYNPYEYKLEADIGCRDRDKVYLVDQISKISENGTEYDSAQVKQMVSNMLVENLTIVARNRMDGTIEIPVFAEGKAQDGWNVVPVSEGTLAQEIVDMARVPEAAPLTGNLFQYEISKSDGGMIPANTYFEVSYRPKLTGNDFRKYDFYKGGSLSMENQAVICYSVSSSDAGAGTKKSGNALLSMLGIRAGGTSTWAAAGASLSNLQYLQDLGGSKAVLSVKTDDKGCSVTTWTAAVESFTAGKEDRIHLSFNDTIHKFTSNLKDDEKNEKVIRLLWKHTTLENFSAYLFEDMYPKGTANLASQEEAGRAILLTKSEDGKSLDFTRGGLSIKVTPTEVFDERYVIYHTSAETGSMPGYADINLFEAEIKGLGYQEEVDIQYDLKVDWPAFMKELLESGLLTYEELKNLDFPYENHMEKDVVAIQEHSWQYPAELHGSLSKKATADGNTIDWTIEASVGGLDFENLTITDLLSADDKVAELTENNKKALKHTSFTDFWVESEDGKELYRYKGTCVPGSTARPEDQAGIWKGAELSFNENGFALKLDVLKEGQKIVIRYRTVTDIDAFVKEGGDPTKEITLANSAAGTGNGVDMSSSTTGGISPLKGPSIEKEKSEKAGKAGELLWKVTGHVGDAAASSLTIADEMTIPDKLEDYISISSIKVTLMTPGAEGDAALEEVIYSSSDEIDRLAERGFQLQDTSGVSLVPGKNGVSGWKLLFNGEKVMLPKGTDVVVEYTASLDREQYLAQFDKEHLSDAYGAFTITNHAVLSRDGWADVDIEEEGDIHVQEELKKTGETQETDAEGKAVTKWTIQLRLSELYSPEELEKAEDVKITDKLSSLQAMSYVEDSVKLYVLDSSQEKGEAVPEDRYSVLVSGKRIIITLSKPVEYPDILIELETSSYAGATISNKAEVEILQKHLTDETPEMTISGQQGGYVISKTRQAEVQLEKTDAETKEALAGAKFMLTVLSCGSQHSGQEHTADCWKPLDAIVQEYQENGYVYKYDTQEAEEFWEQILETDDNGDLVIKGLTEGTYRLTETEPPAGYVLPENEADRSFMFTVNKETFKKTDGTYGVNHTFTYDLTNEPVVVEVYKYFDENIRGKELNGGVAGARLEIWTADKSRKLAEKTTDGNGKATFDRIPQGDYVLVESYAPNGYHRAKNIPISITKDGAVMQGGTEVSKPVSMRDELVTGSIRLTKKGEVLSDNGLANVTAALKGFVVHAFSWIGGTVSDVQFEIYAAEDILLPDGSTLYRKEELIGTIITGRNGIAELDQLPAGSYYAVEKATGENYKLDPTPISIELVMRYPSDPDQEPVLVSYDGSVINERKKAEVSLHKVDQESKEPLAAAVFGLYSAKDQSIFKENELLAVAVTNTEGRADFRIDLPLGSYYVKEIDAPDGYLLSEERYEAEFWSEGPISITAGNISRKLDIYKKNTDGQIIGGCMLKLMDETGKVLDTWLSVADTPHRISGIAPGSYTLSEVKPADGYMKAKDVKFTVSEEQETVEVVMVDKKKKGGSEKHNDDNTPGEEKLPEGVNPVTSPTTGDDTHIGWYLMLLAASLLAGGTILFRRKKK